MDLQEEIKKEAELYLEGYSLREIAKIVGKSHVTVYDHLRHSLKKLNMILALEVQSALEDNAPKSIKDPEVVKRVLAAYNYLVKDNLTVEQIAELLKVGVFTAYRDLNTRLASLNKISPEIVTEEMIQNVKTILASHSLEQLTPGNDGAYKTQNRDEEGRFQGGKK